MNVFIEEHREVFGGEPICRFLQIAPATFHRHAATARNPELTSDRSKQDAVDLEKIKVAHDKSRGRYGARKVWHQLRRDTERLADAGKKTACPKSSKGLSSAMVSATFKLPPDAASPTSAHISCRLRQCS